MIEKMQLKDFQQVIETRKKPLKRLRAGLLQPERVFMVVSESDRVFLFEVVDQSRRLVHEVRFDPREHDPELRLYYRGLVTVRSVIEVGMRLQHWDEEGEPLPDRRVRKLYLMTEPIQLSASKPAVQELSATA